MHHILHTTPTLPTYQTPQIAQTTKDTDSKNPDFLPDFLFISREYIPNTTKRTNYEIQKNNTIQPETTNSHTGAVRRHNVHRMQQRR